MLQMKKISLNDASEYSCNAGEGATASKTIGGIEVQGNMVDLVYFQWAYRIRSVKMCLFFLVIFMMTWQSGTRFLPLSELPLGFDEGLKDLEKTEGETAVLEAVINRPGADVLWFKVRWYGW